VNTCPWALWTRCPHITSPKIQPKILAAKAQTSRPIMPHAISLADSRLLLSKIMSSQFSELFKHPIL
jgi:hypothetical protein